ncbi:hypothetical protein NLI96_g436 [Meripilus lineatus]|uniref:Uncharacterized protein n=1 Tax=Meripilus lineatus TaxID=2056292 RepID=A0AAD5VC99_9APHY|nr:hypothetical protein NLI96_g436 [Physisporinus lineatus]
MKAFTSLIATALFATSAVAQFMINTPANVVVCQPTLLTWTGGTPPYFLRQMHLPFLSDSILPGATPGGEALQQFTGLTDTSFRWSTNIAAGTFIGLTLRDNTGATAQSAPFTINSGPDTSCLSSSAGPSSTGADTSAAGSTTPGTTPSTTPATSPAPSATSPVTTPASSTRPSSASSGSVSRSGSSSSPSASTTGGSQNNGALGQPASLGVAAFLGAAVAAVMA